MIDCFQTKINHNRHFKTLNSLSLHKGQGKLGASVEEKLNPSPASLSAVAWYELKTVDQSRSLLSQGLRDTKAGCSSGALHRCNTYTEGTPL